jgi:hypothetical protein
MAGSARVFLQQRLYRAGITGDWLGRRWRRRWRSGHHGARLALGAGRVRAALRWALRAKSGRNEATLGSVAQLDMHAVLIASGRTCPPISLPGHRACWVLMPLRLGMRPWTWAMFWSDNTKLSGTTLPRFNMKAVTA